MNSTLNTDNNTNNFGSANASEGSLASHVPTTSNTAFRVAAITVAAGAVITMASLLPNAAWAQTTHKTAKHHARHTTAARHRPVVIREVNASWHYPYAQQPASYDSSYVSVSAGQPTHSMSARASSATMSSFTGSSDLPSSATPIMNRIAAMLQASRARAASHLPDGARTSYVAASAALRQALMTGRMGAQGTAPANGSPVSSLQVTDDIQTLRTAAQQAHGRQGAALTQIASLYATGAKEFFTGELRLALLGTGNTRGMAIAINGSGATTERRGTASSSELAKAPGYPNEGHGGGGGVIQSDGTLGSGEPAGLPGPTSPTAPLGGVPPIVTAPVGPVYDGGVVTTPIVTTPIITGPVVPNTNPNGPAAPVVPPVAPTVP